MPPPTFLVDGVIPEVGTGVITGFGGVGKSFLGIDVGACVSLGIPWQGYATKRRPVLIVSLEGAPGPRVEAWKQHHGYNALPDLHFLLETLDLRDKRDADGLLYTADKIDARLVIIDTLNRAMRGWNESSSADMSLATGAMDRVAKELGGVGAFMHHEPLVGGRPRGHSSLFDDSDFAIAVDEQREGSGIFRVKHTKLRNGTNSPRSVRIS